MQEVCVQGRVLAVTSNIASQSRLKSGPRQLFWQGAFRFFACGLEGSVHSCLCRGNRVQVALNLMWHSVRTKLVQIATSRWQDRGTEHDATAQNAP